MTHPKARRNVTVLPSLDSEEEHRRDEERRRREKELDDQHAYDLFLDMCDEQDSY